jgi:hypothetical protein
MAAIIPTIVTFVLFLVIILGRAFYLADCEGRCFLRHVWTYKDLFINDEGGAFQVKICKNCNKQKIKRC